MRNPVSLICKVVVIIRSRAPVRYPNARAVHAVLSSDAEANASPGESRRGALGFSLDRIMIDRKCFLFSINHVNPIYINDLEQIHMVF
jgi:hypothetical protein